MKTLDHFIHPQKTIKRKKKATKKLTYNNIYSHDIDRIPIHHWYTLVAGFSGNFIRENLEKYNIQNGDTILDPFMGTGTSALIGMLNNLKVEGVDANPFTHFVSKVKTNYTVDRSKLKRYFYLIQSKISSNLEKDGQFHWKRVPTIDIKDHLKNIWSSRSATINLEKDGLDPPKMPHLSRWLSPGVLIKLMKLKNTLQNEILPKIASKSIRDLILLAFASIILPVSNLKLAGPKICYRRKGKIRILCVQAPVFKLFIEKLKKMIKDLRYYSGFSGLYLPNLHLGDSRYVDQYVKNQVNIVLTSPPYLNEVDYLDNTRMELYFLEFIKNDKDLKRFKQRQIRGNSKYLFNDNRDYPDNIPSIATFENILKICGEIKEIWEKRQWGWDHPRLVAEYFIDMTMHLSSIKRVLKENGHYIFLIGDSAIDGVLVPTDKLLADIALDLGFSNAKVTPFRKRGSSRHKVQLRESIVTLTN